MELNDSSSSEEEDSEDDEQPRLRRAVTPLYKAPVEYEAISFLLKFEHLSDGNCMEYSNFTRAQIVELTDLLHIDQVVFRNRYTAHPITAFCVLLWRLKSCRRLSELVHEFGHHTGWISSIFNDVLTYLDKEWEERLFWREDWFTLARIQRYAAAVANHTEIGRAHV